MAIPKGLDKTGMPKDRTAWWGLACLGSGPLSSSPSGHSALLTKNHIGCPEWRWHRETASPRSFPKLLHHNHSWVTGCVTQDSQSFQIDWLNHLWSSKPPFQIFTPPAAPKSTKHPVFFSIHCSPASCPHNIPKASQDHKQDESRTS